MNRFPAHLEIRKSPILIFTFLSLVLLICTFSVFAQYTQTKKPNILFCIADDASLEHISAYGFNHTAWVKTPTFDKIAQQGLLFMNAYTPNAKCSPSRACILTGRNPWQLEAAANHNSYFPAKFTTFMEALGKNGYDVGFTGKGWTPGNPGAVQGQRRQLTGKEYKDVKLTPPTKQMGVTNYPGNFEAFLKERNNEKPFAFWFGSWEPHRDYEYGSGTEKGRKKISDINKVPPFWIDNDSTRNDMLDYAFELEYFDRNLQKMLDVLEKNGELENTIIVVTSDNGMPFPRVKGHVYAYDNHLPLAIMWKGHIANPGRKVNDLVSFIDFTPTFLEIAGLTNASAKMEPVQGKSLLQLIKAKSSDKASRSNDHVLLGRERTDVGRPHDEGYPVRAIVKGNFFYARNYEPDRWPCGDPETGYMDTDGSPTKTSILNANRAGLFPNIWGLSFGKHPAELLYDLTNDPYCINNLAQLPKYLKIKNALRTQMERELKQQQDPRMLGNGSIFDKYPYAQQPVLNYYDRFMNGENIPAGWILPTDFEKKGFVPPKF
ncbi:sulfatase [Pedobacter frigoris]|uniref:sulfatase family protein n=1 Tax=Pedobacter frigoris TaxID=2571272 RepID=UPI002930420F|nr:sulfatase [Pedobacter frigoris]